MPDELGKLRECAPRAFLLVARRFGWNVCKRANVQTCDTRNRSGYSGCIREIYIYDAIVWGIMSGRLLTSARSQSVGHWRVFLADLDGGFSCFLGRHWNVAHKQILGKTPRAEQCERIECSVEHKHQEQSHQDARPETIRCVELLLMLCCFVHVCILTLNSVWGKLHQRCSGKLRIKTWANDGCEILYDV